MIAAACVFIIALLLLVERVLQASSTLDGILDRVLGGSPVDDVDLADRRRGGAA